MAMLFAGIYAFGRLSDDNEITAMTASGVPFRRLVLPAMAFALVASLFAFFVSEFVAPWCNFQVEKLRAGVPPQVGSHGASNRMFSDLDSHGRVNMIVYAGTFDATVPALYNITILRYQYAANGEVEEILLTRAQNATYSEDFWWTLEGAWTRQTLADQPMEWQETEIRLHRRPEQISRLDLEARTMTIRMLRDQVEELEATLNQVGLDDQMLDRLNTFRTELGLRFSVPIACLVFAMAGCPMGVRPERSGRSMSFGLSFGVIMLYYIFLHYMTQMGYDGRVPAWFAAWFANLVIGIVGIILIFRVPQ
jgi:lipopolysaccharide export LptBFGC system permease protein LptF